MSILTIFAVWTFPEPTEFLAFDGLNKMLANDLYHWVKVVFIDEERLIKMKTYVGCRSWISCFRQDDTP